MRTRKKFGEIDLEVINNAFNLLRFLLYINFRILYYFTSFIIKKHYSIKLNKTSERVPNPGKVTDIRIFVMLYFFWDEYVAHTRHSWNWSAISFGNHVFEFRVPISSSKVITMALPEFVFPIDNAPITGFTNRQS